MPPCRSRTSVHHSFHIVHPNQPHPSLEHLTIPTHQPSKETNRKHAFSLSLTHSHIRTATLAPLPLPRLFNQLSPPILPLSHPCSFFRLRIFANHSSVISPSFRSLKISSVILSLIVSFDVPSMKKPHR